MNARCLCAGACRLLERCARERDEHVHACLALAQLAEDSALTQSHPPDSAAAADAAATASLTSGHPPDARRTMAVLAQGTHKRE